MFQIKNAQGETISMGKIDEEVAAFWGIELRPRSYASPITVTPLPEGYKKEDDDGKLRKKNMEEMQQRILCNWFDQLGFIIHEGADTWDFVKEKYLKPYEDLLNEYKEEPNFETIRTELMNTPPVKPMLDLIEYWRSKGYTPVPVKE